MANKNLPPAVLLEAIADLLEEFPALHDQDEWESSPRDNECGTRACIAGWACILGTDDFKQKDLKIKKADGTTIGHFWIPKMRTVREYFGDPDMPKRDYDDRIDLLARNLYYMNTGRELLGLTEEESDLLFHMRGQPRDGMTVPEALRAIAKGADVGDVWTNGWD